MFWCSLFVSFQPFLPLPSTCRLKAIRIFQIVFLLFHHMKNVTAFMYISTIKICGNAATRCIRCRKWPDLRLFVRSKFPVCSVQREECRPPLADLRGAPAALWRATPLSFSNKLQTLSALRTEVHPRMWWIVNSCERSWTSTQRRENQQIVQMAVLAIFTREHFLKMFFTFTCAACLLGSI